MVWLLACALIFYSTSLSVTPGLTRRSRSLAQTASLPHKDVYNIGSNDQNVTKRMLGEMIAERMGCKLDIIGDKVKVDPRSYRVDFSKFEKATGFKARLRPQDAIADIAAGLETGA